MPHRPHGTSPAHHNPTRTPWPRSACARIGPALTVLSALLAPPAQAMIGNLQFATMDDFTVAWNPDTYASISAHVAPPTPGPVLYQQIDPSPVHIWQAGPNTVIFDFNNVLSRSKLSAWSSAGYTVPGVLTTNFGFTFGMGANPGSTINHYDVQVWGGYSVDADMASNGLALADHSLSVGGTGFTDSYLPNSSGTFIHTGTLPGNTQGLYVSGYLHAIADPGYYTWLSGYDDFGTPQYTTVDVPSSAWVNIQRIVITAVVPEPETYALSLAGLGMVAWVARRRRRPAA